MRRPFVQPNIVDKIVTFFDPQAGGRRQMARSALAMSGAYAGARYDRRQTVNWITSTGSADADSIPDLPELRARSRDLMRNNTIAIGAVGTLVLNAVGTGLVLQPTPDRTILGWDEIQARAWAKSTAQEFALFADSKDGDITRTTNFFESQALIFHSELENGDAFTILTQKPVPGSIYSTRFQMIEADRVRTPGAEGMNATVKNVNGPPTLTGNKIFGGVEVDQFGAPVAYCILKNHPGSISWTATSLSEYDRYQAFGENTGRRNVLHHFNRGRIEQNRGVPYLAPIIETLKQLDRYKEAEIMAAVITAAYTIFIKTALGDQAIGSESEPAGPMKDGEITLGNGKIVGLGLGEEAQFPDSPRPNVNYDPFVLSMLREIGVCLQLPVEVLTKHFTSSYSAARAALLEAWKFYMNRRVHVAQGFCQPVYEAWMDEAVSKGRVKAPGYFASPLLRKAYLSADWIGDAPGQIDPLKEVNAAKMRIAEGLSDCKTETMALTSRLWEDVHENRVREHQMRAAAGLEPNVLNATGTELVPDDADQEDAADPAPPAKNKAPAKGGKE